MRQHSHCAPLGALQLRGPTPHREKAPRPTRAVEGAVPPHAELCCSVCHTPITSPGAQLAIAGNSVHQRVNPAGVEYEFGCFATAPGATAVGVPSAEHSWFHGYRWCYALCRGCSDHLGWHFRGPEPAFFGLILARLVTLAQPPEGP